MKQISLCIITFLQIMLGIFMVIIAIPFFVFFNIVHTLTDISEFRCFLDKWYSIIFVCYRKKNKR